jgi:hypothetical protein
MRKFSFQYNHQTNGCLSQQSTLELTLDMAGLALIASYK